MLRIYEGIKIKRKNEQHYPVVVNMEEICQGQLKNL